MLQPGDEKWIGQVMSPMAFNLVDGRVFVAANGEREDGPEVKYVDASGPDAPRPMPQDEIEALALDLKRGEHRSNIATSFEDYLVVFSSVSSSGRVSGLSSVGDQINLELKVWAEWGRNMFVQFEQAKSAADVKLSKVPEAPKWHPHYAALKREIARLNQL
jgi:hypothetical protein